MISNHRRVSITPQLMDYLDRDPAARYRLDVFPGLEPQLKRYPERPDCPGRKRLLAHLEDWQRRSQYKPSLQ